MPHKFSEVIREDDWPVVFPKLLLRMAHRVRMAQAKDKNARRNTHEETIKSLNGLAVELDLKTVVLNRIIRGYLSLSESERLRFLL